jgi:cyclohexa-1,5-dienecarbonyl-CoA hydratase
MPVELDVANRIARVTLNAPPLNILTSGLHTELLEALKALRARDDHNAVIIDSAVPGVFSAGADVREHIGRENCHRMLQSAHAMLAELLRAPVPTICVVDGRCLGGGFELALACDQILCSQSSEFGTPEIRLGCYPPAAMVLMPQKLPSMLAAELVQSGRTISAGEFIMRAGARPGVQNTLPDIYAELPRGPLVQATRLLRAGAAERFLAAVGGIEQAYLEQLLQLHDAKEGPEAFLAKRRPAWDHEDAK